jgi:Flp pilus assembly protein TadG
VKIQQTKLPRKRDAVAAVEFAVLAPLLFFFFAIGVDFARVFYAHTIITQASRNAAIYGSSDPTKADDTTTMTAIALADTSDLSSGVTVTPNKVTANGVTYIQVVVSYPFKSVTGFFTKTTFTINQKCLLPIQPTEPRQPATY